MMTFLLENFIMGTGLWREFNGESHGFLFRSYKVYCFRKENIYSAPMVADIDVSHISCFSAIL